VIWLQILTVFWLGGVTISLNYSVYMGLVTSGRQKYYSRTTTACEFEMAIGKLKRQKSPSTDQFPAELIKAGGRTIRSETHKFINYIWNKEELPEEWKESISVPIYKKGDKRDCGNYRGISLFTGFFF